MRESCELEEIVQMPVGLGILTQPCKRMQVTQEAKRILLHLVFCCLLLLSPVAPLLDEHRAARNPCLILLVSKVASLSTSSRGLRKLQSL